MKILFLHGWTSVPGGLKPRYLTECGHQVVNPALPDDDFSEAVRIAQAEFDRQRPDVVVGSSRGGSVAMNIDTRDVPLVLLCPAWKRWGTANRVKRQTTLLHSRADDIIPFADTLELIANSDLPLDCLIETGSDHRLADPEPLAALARAVQGNRSAAFTDAAGSPPKYPLVRYRDEIPPQTCPFGQVQRVVTGGEGGVANVHVVQVTQGTTHVHTGYDEVYYVLCGTGKIILGRETHSLRPGAVTVIPAGVPHSLEADDGCELEFIIFGTPPMSINDERAKPKKA